MEENDKLSWFERLKRLLIGKARSPYDMEVFNKISLIAFFAWVGLGADGLSSSAYGPQETFLALNGHLYLSIFVALGSALTIFIISASYSQIIELFPTGGGGYLVASKLLSPNVGMVSGCALLIDYVLTITVSIASGADAIFSFLPVQWQVFKLEFAAAGLIVLIILNLRGVKESVTVLIPVFMLFVLTHMFAIFYSLFANMVHFPEIVRATQNDIVQSRSEIGLLGMILIILRAYSMGAGTYTGIEAVSNGLPILREPRVKTAKRTMRYMAISLTFVVVGLIISYLFYQVGHVEGKTLNAVLFENMTAGWGKTGHAFVFLILFSEAALLFIAAQAGFIDGPRILANMALDRWLPTRFAMLSDRFVNKNGVVIMGISAIIMMIVTGGSVTFLVVLYSINVFITFTLSQLGMVTHWWRVRARISDWRKKITINGVGLILTSFILISMIVIKFHEGGWITLLITGTLMVFAIFIRRHYYNTAKLLKRLNSLVQAVGVTSADAGQEELPNPQVEFNPNDKTAVLLVNGFNGLGLHTLFGIMRLFSGVFKNFIFIEIGVIDSGNFKGVEELDKLDIQVRSDVDHYVNYMRKEGYHADGISLIGTDVIVEIEKITPKILEKFPNVVFFGGQLVFPEDSFITRWLHNYTVFAMQRKFYSQGVPFVLLPIRV
ncbi:MAG: amino acid transporter [Elusimicrobia bacterium RIFOXYA2_FULL_50_26]|nr:MAG: amino acid transporter [Elusimicrobia bacterium RIFOXYA2_FULL_50_26]